MPNLKAKLKEIASKLSAEPKASPIVAMKDLPEVVSEEPDLTPIPEECIEIDISPVLETDIQCSCGRKRRITRRPDLDISEEAGTWLEITSCNCGELGAYMREADYNRWRATQRRQK